MTGRHPFTLPTTQGGRAALLTKQHGVAARAGNPPPNGGAGFDRVERMPPRYLGAISSASTKGDSMPSEAGEKNYYLVNGKRYPRVTSVIKDTVAKPAVMKWMYTQTRDTISGLVNVLSGGDGVNKPLVTRGLLLDMLSDADMLEEYLAENELRPQDVMEAQGVIGTERHELFETLGRLGLASPSRAWKRAEWILKNTNDGHERAIADWWLTRMPIVTASEVRLPSHEHVYCGTCDLVWENDLGLTITDLKNRKADDPCVVAHRTEGAADRCHVRHSYESDQIQVGAYEIAWNELNPRTPAVRRTVLIAKADGRWTEDEVTLDSSIFLDYLSAWKKLKGVV